MKKGKGGVSSSRGTSHCNSSRDEEKMKKKKIKESELKR